MNQVRIFALGGLDEDGKNMYVVEVDQSIFVIEAGEITGSYTVEKEAGAEE